MDIPLGRPEAGLGARRRPARRGRASIQILLCLLLLWPAARALASNPADHPVEPAQIETERRMHPGGNHPVAALDAYLLGREAWAAGDADRAVQEWKRATQLDLNFLPARLQLLEYYATRNFQYFADMLRECLEIGARDFGAQRWLLANAILGVTLALTLAAIAVAVGLVARHFRSVHHSVMETLSYALRAGRAPAGLMAVAVLALPFLANLGVLVAAVFFLFLASYRFRQGERVLALAAGAWALLVGPLLLVSAPWWSLRTDGRDAALIGEAQHAPTSPAFHRRVQDWIANGERIGAALYLEGLASKVAGDGHRATKFFHRAAGSAEIPPWILETNIGNAHLLAGNRRAALNHYNRAIELEGAAFEPHYNLALAHAAQGRYLSADIEFDRASRLNLDRLRSLSRRSDRFDPSTAIDALWSAPDLWTWTLRNPARALTPEPLAVLFPLRSLAWTTPLALLAMISGILCGRWLRRLIRVHECYQCGRPVCRRCLERLERRAYCPTCAESLGGMSSGEATRLLLRRLLDEKPNWTAQLSRHAAHFLPGIGSLIHGNPAVAWFTVGTAAAALACLLYGSWGQPLRVGPWEAPLTGVIHGAGWALLLLSWVTTVAGVRSSQRRSSNLQTFLSRDVDRLAA